MVRDLEENLCQAPPPQCLALYPRMLHPAPLIWRWWLTLWSTTGQDAEKSLEGMTISKWDTCVTPAFIAEEGQGESENQQECASAVKMNFPTTTVHLYTPTYGSKNQSAKIPTWTRERLIRSLPYLRSFSNHGGWSRERQFLQGCRPERMPMLQKMALCSCTYRQH